MYLILQTYKCTFHTCREIVSTTHNQQRFMLKQTLCQFLDFIVEF